MGTGSKHDRKMLVLLYKMVFAKTYPADTFNIIIEPKSRPINDIYYIPDILITKEDKIIFWIEVGSLAYEKAKTLIAYLGKDRFIHIPEGHTLFKLDYTEDGSTLTPEPLQGSDMFVWKNHSDFEQTFRQQEVELIEQAILDSMGSLHLAGAKIGLSMRQLRYKMDKYGINKNAVLGKGEISKKNPEK